MQNHEKVHDNNNATKTTRPVFFMQKNSKPTAIPYYNSRKWNGKFTPVLQMQSELSFFNHNPWGRWKTRSQFPTEQRELILKKPWPSSSRALPFSQKIVRTSGNTEADRCVKKETKRITPFNEKRLSGFQIVVHLSSVIERSTIENIWNTRLRANVKSLIFCLFRNLSTFKDASTRQQLLTFSLGIAQFPN